jgi:hypothetical protein
MAGGLGTTTALAQPPDLGVAPVAIPCVVALACSMAWWVWFGLQPGPVRWDVVRLLGPLPVRIFGVLGGSGGRGGESSLILGSESGPKPTVPGRAGWPADEASAAMCRDCPSRTSASTMYTSGSSWLACR